MNSINNSPEGTELLVNKVELEALDVVTMEELLVDNTVLCCDTPVVVERVLVCVVVVCPEGIRYNAEAATTIIATRITTATTNIDIPE